MGYSWLKKNDCFCEQILPFKNSLCPAVPPPSHTHTRGLTHLSLSSHKRGTGKQYRPRSDAADRGTWLRSTLFALSSESSTKQDDNKKLTRHPLHVYMK